MSVQFNIDSIKQSLTCNICQDIVTLPVHSKCCEASRNMSPACMSCVRNYCDLNKPNNQRVEYRKSWNGCGCDIYCKNPAYLIYNHTIQLDMIRNSLGPSLCHNEGCKKSFDSAAALRRHLTGTSRNDDIHGNCMYSYTKCKYCNFHEKRIIVEGIHFKNYHCNTYCNVCNKYIKNINLKDHYSVHKIHMQELRTIVKAINSINLESNINHSSC